jgi:hypothetical protein
MVDQSMTMRVSVCFLRGEEESRRGGEQGREH